MTEHMARKQLPVPGDRLLRGMKIAVAVATLAVLVWIGWLVYQQDGELDDAQGSIRSQGKAIDDAAVKQAELDDALKKANARLRSNDLPVVPTPSLEPDEPGDGLQRGPQGLRGPRGPGPTPAQVAAAVATECADGCTSVVQVAAAVDRYCAANMCGTPGEAGTDGAQGPVGPGADDEQVKAQVAAYCAANPCGTPGPQGEKGTVVPGEYFCGEREWVRGLTVAADGTVTLTCSGFPF